jgi:uncharacterized surface protein with fasciclin (FAS1) repeats
MYDLKVLFAVGLLCSLSITSNGAINAQQIDSSSQTSAASIDRQMSDEARTPPRGSSFYFALKYKILRSWEKTVDAAGLHNLLNQNQKAYTLFKPDLDKMTQDCSPPRRSGSLTKLEMEQIRQCISAPREDVLSKLFAIENQPDLQRVLRCHVVPQKIMLKDLPNDKELTFKTMEPGCTITVRAKHSQAPEMKAVVVGETRQCSMQGIGNVVCVATGRNTRYVPTGKMEYRTQLFVNNDSTGTRLETDVIYKGGGNYVVYDSIGGVIIPPDLKGKYGGLPAGGRPLTD